MMSDARKARLDVIDDSLGFDETVTIDVLALLFDPGGGMKKREAEGYLVLTDRRLIFGTAKHGILVDLPLKEIKVPVTLRYRYMMARLVVQADSGITHTFVINKSAARDMAFAVNRPPTA
jgi:hypothetical protein